MARWRALSSEVMVCMAATLRRAAPRHIGRCSLSWARGGSQGLGDPVDGGRDVVGIDEVPGVGLVVFGLRQELVGAAGEGDVHDRVTAAVGDEDLGVAVQDGLPAL